MALQRRQSQNFTDVKSRIYRNSVSVYLVGKGQRRNIPKYLEDLLEEDCMFCFLSAQKCVKVLKHGILSNMRTTHVFRLKLFCFGSQERAVWEKLLGLHFMERLLTWNNIVLFVYRKNCTDVEKMHFIAVGSFVAVLSCKITL